MTQQTSNTLDVDDVEFELERTQKAFHVSRRHAIRNHVQLMAISRPYDLVFTGAPYGIKMRVFILSNWLNAKRYGDGRGSLARAVYLPSQALLMSCSSDGMMLAISYRLHGEGHLHIYSVPSFLRPNIETLYDIVIDECRCVLPLQLLWNPKIPNKLAVVLTNGRIRVYTLLADGQYEIDEPKVSCINKARSGAWSPDGTQVAFGFSNGTLRIFDMQLNPERTITCPSNVHATPFTTIALNWLRPNKFFAAFQESGENKIPSIYHIDARPGATPTYTNFGDVTDAETGPRAQQIIFTHIPEWDQMLVTSANGKEVGLLGSRDDGTSWQHYRLPERSRLKMIGAENERIHPGGLVYSPNSQKEITRGENEKILVPMIHIFASDGDIRSYNYSNLNPSAQTLGSPPPAFPSPTPPGFEPLTKSTSNDAADDAKTATDFKETQTDFDSPSSVPPVVGVPQTSAECSEEPLEAEAESPKPFALELSRRDQISQTLKPADIKHDKSSQTEVSTLRPPPISVPVPEPKEQPKPEVEEILFPPKKTTSTVSVQVTSSLEPMPTKNVAPLQPPPTSEKQTQVEVEKKDKGTESLPLPPVPVCPPVPPPKSLAEKQTQADVPKADVGAQPLQVPQVLPPPHITPPPEKEPPQVVPPPPVEKPKRKNIQGTQTVSSELDSTKPIALRKPDKKSIIRRPKETAFGATQTEPDTKMPSEPSPIKTTKQPKPTLSSESQTDQQIYATKPIQSTNFWGKKRKSKPPIPATGPIIGDNAQQQKADENRVKEKKTQETQITPDIAGTQPFGKLGKKLMRIAKATGTAQKEKGREVGGGTLCGENINTESNFSLGFNVEANLVSVSSFYIRDNEIKLESVTYRESAGSETEVPKNQNITHLDEEIRGAKTVPSDVLNTTKYDNKNLENVEAKIARQITHTTLHIEVEPIQMGDTIGKEKEQGFESNLTNVIATVPENRNVDTIGETGVHNYISQYLGWMRSVTFTDSYMFISLLAIAIFFVLAVGLLLYSLFK